MAARLRIAWEPAEVPVSDERQNVKGAQVCIWAKGTLVSLFEGKIIPREGVSLECWLGERLASEIAGKHDLVEALADAAERGAAGKSGEIHV